jgi:MarR family transcriptional regulator, organic hydroperoxide resistance regulator
MKRASLEESLSYLIARAHAKVESDLALRLKPLSFSVGSYRVLIALSDSGPLPMSELADAVLVEPHSLTKLIDKMVAEGLVFRLPDDHDRRKVLVSLAEDGRSIIPKLRKVAAAHEAHIGTMITHKDIRGLERVLGLSLEEA